MRLESKVSKRVQKCNRYRGWGHHKNTCKKSINLTSVSAPEDDVFAVSQSQMQMQSER